MKRSRTTTDTLTGGTKDVNPQLLICQEFSLETANQFREVRVALPIVRLPARGTKAIVMEILKIYWILPSYGNDFTAPDNTPFPDGSIVQVQMQIATASQQGMNPGNPAVIGYISRKYKGNHGKVATEDAPNEAYCTVFHNPIVHDYTDGAGHGVLIATDAIFIGADTSEFRANSPSFNCRVLYRWNEVGLTEFLGMVTHQQTPGAQSGPG